MKKSFLFFVLLCIGTCTSVLCAQSKKISGVVMDKDANMPLIGANVIVKGTTNGTITDLDGKYSLTVNASDVVTFSFIGMENKEETVGERTVINVELTSGTLKINEVVVTAMGIERKAKSLTYATQSVGGDELTRAKETNLINSLQGKTSGLTISPNSSGAGGSSKLLIRGNKSAQGNNQPLIVIDGMPMSNNSSTQLESEYGGRDGGDALSNLNPDDISSMNVLKGASAAALYGSMAANGVILITTKKGREGAARVDFSSNVTMESQATAPNLQSTYGATVLSDGSLSDNSWGDKITGEAKGANRVDDFFRTGATFINSVSINGGGEKLQGFASYANTYANGIMPTNNFQRHNMTLKETIKLFNNKVTVDGSLNYIIQKGTNRPEGGQYFSPLTGLYTFPANGDFAYYKNNYKIFDAVNNYDTQNWYRDVNQDFSANPYWVLNNNRHTEKRDRMMVSGTVKYDITDYLNVQGRLNYDKTADKYERKVYATTSSVLINGSNGRYTVNNYNMRQFYGDILANFNKTFYEWEVNASLGTSFLDYSTSRFDYDTTGELLLPNYFVIAADSKNGVKNYDSPRKRLNAVFATAQVGYKGMIYVDVTGRNDWSSTLAFTNNTSYFYPAFGVTALLNEMMPMSEKINLLKLRGSYSIVGNDTPAYITNPLNGFNNGSVSMNNNIPFTEMKPEKLKSLELGFDLGMFDNRFNWDFTFYKSNNTNQYFAMNVPTGTGYSQYYFNAGDIQNAGFETSFSYSHPITSDLTWKGSFNISYNDNEIKNLDDRLDYVNIGSARGYDFRLVKGGSFGDIYAKKLMKDENGVIVTDNNGRPQLSANKEFVGNVNSKWNLGLSNTFNYKDYSLYFLFDGRIGGNTVSATQATLDSYGVSEESANARDNGGVDAGNGTKIDAYKYYSTVGANGGAGDQYVYSATNFRMRELSLGYTFRNLLGVSKNLSINLVGRNLFFIYKDSPNDPEMSMSTSNGYQGIDYFALPSTRSFGFNLKATF